MTWLYWLAVVLIWVLVGLAATSFLQRHGHRDPSWWVVGALLGPLFVPIALERVRRGSWTLERSAARSGHGSAVDTAGFTVLVGVDGSPESDQAVRDAARLMAGGARRVILASVVDADSGDHATEDARRWARDLLGERAGWLPRGGTDIETEVAVGAPARALLDLAESEGVDLLVVGRRGSGLSGAVIGSVAQHLTSHAPRAVLLAAPPANDR